MRGLRVLSLWLTLVTLCAGGCAPRHDAAQPARLAAPAPPNPDLTPVIERFYQQVEADHWTPAYGMLSPRLRAALPRAEFVQRYRGFENADIHARQTGDRAVHVRLTAPGRTADETVTFVWDGEVWLIDAIARR